MAQRCTFFFGRNVKDECYLHPLKNSKRFQFPLNVIIPQRIYQLISGVFLGGAPISTCNFFRPSVCPSVAQHISGTVHHLTIIFGTHV